MFEEISTFSHNILVRRGSLEAKAVGVEGKNTISEDCVATRTFGPSASTRKSQGAFHVRPTPKVRRSLSFRTPGIFRERELLRI